jgi:hypothetical protein
LVSPRSIAALAAAFTCAGVSKSGSPAEQRHDVAPLRLQRAGERGDGHGGRGLDARQRVGEKGHGRSGLQCGRGVLGSRPQTRNPNGGSPAMPDARDGAPRSLSEPPGRRIPARRPSSGSRGCGCAVGGAALREMDLLLGAFAEAELARLPPAALADYETLLSENDQDLYLWVSKREGLPAATRPSCGASPPSTA